MRASLDAARPLTSAEWRAHSGQRFSLRQPGPSFPPAFPQLCPRRAPVVSQFWPSCAPTLRQLWPMSAAQAALPTWKGLRSGKESPAPLEDEPLAHHDYDQGGPHSSYAQRRADGVPMLPGATPFGHAPPGAFGACSQQRGFPGGAPGGGAAWEERLVSRTSSAASEPLTVSGQCNGSAGEVHWHGSDNGHVPFSGPAQASTWQAAAHAGWPPDETMSGPLPGAHGRTRRMGAARAAGPGGPGYADLDHELAVPQGQRRGGTALQGGETLSSNGAGRTAGGPAATEQVLSAGSAGGVRQQAVHEGSSRAPSAGRGTRERARERERGGEGKGGNRVVEATSRVYSSKEGKRAAGAKGDKKSSSSSSSFSSSTHSQKHRSLTPGRKLAAPDGAEKVGRVVADGRRMAATKGEARGRLTVRQSSPTAASAAAPSPGAGIVPRSKTMGQGMRRDAGEGGASRPPGSVHSAERISLSGAGPSRSKTPGRSGKWDAPSNPLGALGSGRPSAGQPRSRTPGRGLAGVPGPAPPFAPAPGSGVPGDGVAGSAHTQVWAPPPLMRTMTGEREGPGAGRDSAPVPPLLRRNTGSRAGGTPSRHQSPWEPREGATTGQGGAYTALGPALGPAGKMSAQHKSPGPQRRAAGRDSPGERGYFPAGASADPSALFPAPGADGRYTTIPYSGPIPASHARTAGTHVKGMRAPSPGAPGVHHAGSHGQWAVQDPGWGSAGVQGGVGPRSWTLGREGTSTGGAPQAGQGERREPLSRTRTSGCVPGVPQLAQELGLEDAHTEAGARPGREQGGAGWASDSPHLSRSNTMGHRGLRPNLIPSPSTGAPGARAGQSQGYSGSIPLAAVAHTHSEEDLWQSEGPGSGQGSGQGGGSGVAHGCRLTHASSAEAWVSTRAHSGGGRQALGASSPEPGDLYPAPLAHPTWANPAASEGVPHSEPLVPTYLQNGGYHVPTYLQNGGYQVPDEECQLFMGAGDKSGAPNAEGGEEPGGANRDRQDLSRPVAGPNTPSYRQPGRRGPRRASTGSLPSGIPKAGMSPSGSGASAGTPESEGGRTGAKAGAGEGPDLRTRPQMFRSQSEQAQAPSPDDALHSPHVFSDSSSNDSSDHVSGCASSARLGPEEALGARYAAGKPAKGGRGPAEGGSAAGSPRLAAPFLQTHVYSDKKRTGRGEAHQDALSRPETLTGDLGRPSSDAPGKLRLPSQDVEWGAVTGPSAEKNGAVKAAGRSMAGGPGKLSITMPEDEQEASAGHATPGTTSTGAVATNASAAGREGTAVSGAGRRGVRGSRGEASVQGSGSFWGFEEEEEGARVLNRPQRQEGDGEDVGMDSTSRAAGASKEPFVPPLTRSLTSDRIIFCRSPSYNARHASGRWDVGAGEGADPADRYSAFLEGAGAGVGAVYAAQGSGPAVRMSWRPLGDSDAQGELGAAFREAVGARMLVRCSSIDNLAVSGEVMEEVSPLPAIG